MTTTNEYAPSLDGIPMPKPIRALRIDPIRRMPVPWFVTWIDGKPEFRVADGRKFALALEARLCWVCGTRIRDRMAFVLGPMCTVTRTSAEPPCHIECAVFSVRACPFLSRPKMERREGGIPEGAGCAGHMITRNPGVGCVWGTTVYTPFRDGPGVLLNVGDPIRDMVSWWAEGRKATRAEVEASIDSGLPILREMAEKDGPRAVADLERMTDDARRYLP